MLRHFLTRIDDPLGGIDRKFDPAGVRLAISDYELGLEGREEVKRILSSRRKRFDIHWAACRLPVHHSWTVTSSGTSLADIIAFPPATAWHALPTSTEVRLVQAADRLPQADFEKISSDGGTVSFVAPGQDVNQVSSLLSGLTTRPGINTALLHSQIIEIDYARMQFAGSKKSIPIFALAYSANPLKYHFLEVYRSIEIQFLHEIFSDIESNFFKNPKPSVEKAKNDLNAELNQIIKLTRRSPANFELVADSIFSMVTTGNSFALALKEKHDLNKNPGQSRSEHGAVFVYYMRCAIVHAGEKDLIYESFSDADDLIKTVMPSAEKAALEISGLRCL